MTIGRVRLAAGDYDAAREGYKKAFEYPAIDQTYMRASIQMHIADSSMAEKDYKAAMEAYQAAQKIGPGDWHKDHIEKNLAEAKKRAE